MDYYFSVQNRVFYRKLHTFFFHSNVAFIIIKCVFDHIEDFNKFQNIGKSQTTIFKWTPRKV